MTLRPGRIVRDYLQRIARRGRDVASTMSVELIGALSLLVIFPITIRSLGPEMYGKYTVLYLIVGIIGLWVHAGPAASIVQLILQMEFDPHEVMRVSRRQMLIVWAPSALLGTVVAVALVGRDLLVPAALVIIVDLLLAGLASMNMANIFAVDGVTRAAYLRMMVPVCRTCAVLVLALTDHVSIVTLVCVNILASALTLTVTTVMIRRRRRPDWVGDLQPGPRLLLRYSCYYSASMSTNAVQDEGEKFVLASYRPAVEVGEYAAAYRVVQTSLIPMSALMAAASRWFLQKDDRPRGQLERAERLSVVVTVYGLLVAVAIFFGADIIQWFVGDQYSQATTISRWLIFFPLLHGLADLAPMGLLGLGRNRARMFMGFGTTVAALIAYLVLVPPFGWRGAVLGTYVSETVCVVLGWVLLIRYQHAADKQPLADGVPRGEPLTSDSG